MVWFWSVCLAESFSSTPHLFREVLQLKKGSLQPCGYLEDKYFLNLSKRSQDYVSILEPVQLGRAAL